MVLERCARFCFRATVSLDLSPPPTMNRLERAFLFGICQKMVFCFHLDNGIVVSSWLAEKGHPDS